MHEADDTTPLTGIEAFQFLQTLGVKVGKTKVYADIQKGKLPCLPDKRICKVDLLAYAEKLKAPTPAGEREKSLHAQMNSLFAGLLRDILPHLAPSPALTTKLDNWLHEAAQLPEERTLAAVRCAVETAKHKVPPVRQPLRTPQVLLQGIALGIAAKGRVYTKDSLFLARWLRGHASLCDNPHVKALLHAAERVNLHEQAEHDGLLSALQQQLNAFIIGSGLTVPVIKLKGGVWRKQSHPSVVIAADELLFDAVDTIDFSAGFCFTGLFAFGSREQCEQAVLKLGGYVKQKLVLHEKQYLVVGSASNPQWVTPRAGTKIQDAVYLRQTGKDVLIIHEDVWVECLLAEQRKRGLISAQQGAHIKFNPPWVLGSVAFVMPPCDFPTIRKALQAEGVRVHTSSLHKAEAIVMPSGVLAASEALLTSLPGIGPVTAALITQARDSGTLIVSEDEFRTWLG